MTRCFEIAFKSRGPEYCSALVLAYHDCSRCNHGLCPVGRHWRGNAVWSILCANLVLLLPLRRNRCLVHQSPCWRGLCFRLRPSSPHIAYSLLVCYHELQPSPGAIEAGLEYFTGSLVQWLDRLHCSKFSDHEGVAIKQQEYSSHCPDGFSGLGRVWMFSWWGSVFMVLVSTYRFPRAAFTIQSLQLQTWVQLRELKGLSMAVNVLGAISDLLIALTLVFYLRRSKTGFKRSDHMIHKLIFFSVSTGILTSVCAIASLVSILCWGETLIYVAFYFSLGRLYFNSVLATLNARKDIRADADPEDLTFSLQTFSKVRNASAPPRPTLSIKIDTTLEVDSGQSERSCITEKSQEEENYMVCQV